MKTREQIAGQLRLDCPIIDGHAPGDPYYEAKIAEWTERMYNAQPSEAEENRRVWTPFDFFTRVLQPSEFAAIRAARSANDDIAKFYELAGCAREIVSDNPMTVAALNLMENAGFINGARKAAILATSSTPA